MASLFQERVQEQVDWRMSWHCRDLSWHSAYQDDCIPMGGKQFGCRHQEECFHLHRLCSFQYFYHSQWRKSPSWKTECCWARPNTLLILVLELELPNWALQVHLEAGLRVLWYHGYNSVFGKYSSELKTMCREREEPFWSFSEWNEQSEVRHNYLLPLQQPNWPGNLYKREKLDKKKPSFQQITRLTIYKDSCCWHCSSNRFWCS